MEGVKNSIAACLLIFGETDEYQKVLFTVTHNFIKAFFFFNPRKQSVMKTNKK